MRVRDGLADAPHYRNVCCSSICKALIISIALKSLSSIITLSAEGVIMEQMGGQGVARPGELVLRELTDMELKGFQSASRGLRQRSALGNPESLTRA